MPHAGQLFPDVGGLERSASHEKDAAAKFPRSFLTILTSRCGSRLTPSAFTGHVGTRTARQSLGRIMDRNSALPLYQRLLGGEWPNLEERVRGAHSQGQPVHLFGSFQVERGKGRIARLLVWLWRFPVATGGVSTRVLIVPSGKGEKWERDFGGRLLMTIQGEASGLLEEQFGILQFWFELRVVNRELRYSPKGAGLRLGSFFFPLPRWLAPQVVARESAGEGKNETHVQVRVTHPFLGLLVSYEGTVTRQEPNE